MVSKHTPSQIVLRQSNSQQRTPSKRFASWILWGISSAGRALAWHARGQRFDPAILHQKSTVLRLKYGAFLFAFLEVALKIIQMPDFAGTWTATPNSCCFVVSENACSMPDCFAGGRITPPQSTFVVSTTSSSFFNSAMRASQTVCSSSYCAINRRYCRSGIFPKTLFSYRLRIKASNSSILF